METVNTLQAPRNRILHTCFLLVCLCVIDAIFTDLGIRNGHIQEVNPLMKFIYEMNIVVFYLSKIILPIILLSLMHFVKPSTLLRNLIIISLIAYVLVISMHIYWVIIVIAFL